MSLPDELLRSLQAWLDEEQGRAALDHACALAQSQALDVAELLAWTQNYRCAPERRRLALLALRAALGLRAIPGPVCRAS